MGSCVWSSTINAEISNQQMIMQQGGFHICKSMTDEKERHEIVMKQDLTSLEVFKLKENHQFDAELSIIDRSAACYIVIQLVWQSPYFR